MQPDPILVHQMGKVGSKTVELSLRKAYEALGIQVPIYHTHILNGFEDVKKDVLGNPHLQESENHFATIFYGESIRARIDETPAQHWNIISLVRDPIARNVSAFFESFPDYIPDWRQRYAQGKLTVYEIQALFLKSGTAYETPDYWFDSQLKSIPAFGFDVYASPFPHNVGYKIYPGKAQASLLLIRLENLKECAGTAIQEFLKLKSFSLYNTNTTDEKEFAEIYRAFNELPLPVEYVEERYKTRFARHFYSDEEREVFTKRWTKRAEIASDKQFDEMEKSVRILATQVVEKTRALRLLNAELSKIKNSEVWKLAMFIQRIQLRVFPPNSLITRLAQRIVSYIVLPFLRMAKLQNVESDLALLRSSDLFDEAWYLKNNHDVAKTKMDPVYHYLLHGGFQGRDPSPNFSSRWYLENYKDVKKARVNPLVHYLINGRKEGRLPLPQPGKVKE
jgi:hypothetical protein